MTFLKTVKMYRWFNAFAMQNVLLTAFLSFNESYLHPVRSQWESLQCLRLAVAVEITLLCEM